MPSWVSLLLPIIGSIVSVAVAYAVLRTKVDRLMKDREDDKTELKKHLDSASNNLQQALQALTVFTHEQTIINQFTTKSLENLVKKQEEMEKRLNDQNSTIQLLVELVKRLEKANVE